MKNFSQKQGIGGFTIIEISIVVLIGGILLSSLSLGLLTYMKTAKMKTTVSRMDAIHAALQQYLDVNKKLPCPATYTAPLDDADFGREVTTTCNSGAAQAGTFRAGAGAGAVRIGAVPVRSLNLPDQFIADAWQTRFTYAVTEKLATDGQFVQTEGKIGVIDTNDNPVANPPDSAQYVVISHGENKSGGYGLGGTIQTTCVTADMEGLNCDFGGTTEFRKTLITSTAGSNTRYDDLVMFQTALSDESSIPAGAVMAFNLGTCPDGWNPMSGAVGRVIVGMGDYSETYTVGTRTWNFSNNYPLNTTGGYATWRLNKDEMPTHDHNMPMDGNAFEQITSGASPFRSVHDNSSTDTDKKTFSSGGDLAHENRQPYLALLYCQKV